MMLIEIIRNQKSKIIIMILLIIMVLCNLDYFFIRHMNDKYKYLSKQLSTEEFQMFSGSWEVVEYMGESVEYHGAERTTETEEVEHDEFVVKMKEKYMNKILNIDKEHIKNFYAPTELGYRYDDWESLFSIYRQSPYIWDTMEEPYFCASVELKGFTDSFDVILDKYGNMVLTVKGCFFKLENTN